MGSAQSGELAFYVNSHGNCNIDLSYWVLNGTNGAVIQYKNSTTSTSLPLIIGQGQSSIFRAISLNPQIVVPLGAKYVIKVLTSRGMQGMGRIVATVDERDSQLSSRWRIWFPRDDVFVIYSGHLY